MADTSEIVKCGKIAAFPVGGFSFLEFSCFQGWFTVPFVGIMTSTA
jgi:hypothetical protein